MPCCYIATIGSTLLGVSGRWLYVRALFPSAVMLRVSRLLTETAELLEALNDTDRR